MTGLDCLREEMERRGCTKSQIESKTAAIVLDILTKDRAKYAKQVDAENEESKALSKLRSDISASERTLAWNRMAVSDLEIRYKDIVRQADKAQEYIDKFLEALKDCETAEGRDAMRRAQVFVNSVSVDSKYDNTAFIIALGAILSGGEYGPIEELKKINPKISIEQEAMKPKPKMPILHR